EYAFITISDISSSGSSRPSVQDVHTQGGTPGYRSSAPLSAALAATLPEMWNYLRELLQRVEWYVPRFPGGDAVLNGSFEHSSWTDTRS
ncbi:hypothetical protein ACWDTG_26105, partial [Rhodococcus zopfii]